MRCCIFKFSVTTPSTVTRVNSQTTFKGYYQYNFPKAVSIQKIMTLINHEQKLNICIFVKITIIWAWTLSPSIELASNYTDGVGNNLLTSSNLFLCSSHPIMWLHVFRIFIFLCGTVPASLSITVDPDGYILYCPCMG